MVSIISVGSSAHKSATSAEVRVSSQGVLPLRSVAVGPDDLSSFSRAAAGISEYCFSFSWTAGEPQLLPALPSTDGEVPVCKRPTDRVLTSAYVH